MKYIKYSLFSILTIFFLLSGCSSGYKASGFGFVWDDTSGYSEFKKTPDSFIVTYKGRSSANYEKIMQYAFKRAAELTMQNGYKYFSVISCTDHTETYTSINPHLYVHQHLPPCDKDTHFNKAYNMHMHIPIRFQQPTKNQKL